MLVCIDVDYQDDHVRAASLGFDAWDAAHPVFQFAQHHPTPAAPYHPGEFYKRELPYLLAALDHVRPLPEVVIIDGYVWLDRDRPGLGARLHDSLYGRCAVVGVAKNPFVGAPGIPVLRGESKKPLLVTALGMPLEEAAEAVRGMHGEHRIPTLLKRVDSLARGLELAPQSRIRRAQF